MRYNVPFLVAALAVGITPTFGVVAYRNFGTNLLFVLNVELELGPGDMIGI